MMSSKQKYVRLIEYDTIIIFNEIISHDTFKHLGVKSAGFCYIEDREVKCFGESYSLGLKSLEEDTKIATHKIFGE